MISRNIFLQVDLVIKSIANSSALTITTTAIDTFIVALQESLAELKVVGLLEE
jgi:hypothetical protein